MIRKGETRMISLIETLEKHVAEFPDWDVECDECGNEVSDAYCASLIDKWTDELQGILAKARASVSTSERRTPE